MEDLLFGVEESRGRQVAGDFAKECSLGIDKHGCGILHNMIAIPKRRLGLAIHLYADETLGESDNGIIRKRFRFHFGAPDAALRLELQQERAMCPFCQQGSGLKIRRPVKIADRMRAT